MAHCLASCDSLISSSFAYAEPAAITAAVLSIVPVRNFRIPFLPVTVQPGCFDADKPKLPGLGTDPCLGKSLRQRVTAFAKVRGPFFSRTQHSLRRSADTP